MVSVSPGDALHRWRAATTSPDGENYEGSSCRGAIKGWFNNGVCLEDDWPYEPDSLNPARYGFATRGDAEHVGRVLPGRHQV